jgi:DNA-binding PadR family transcriptional regulator
MQKDLRTAWLLLLLRDGSSYGYELRRELGVRELDVDPAVMYRSLRDMEHSGLIASRWMRSDAGGPSRRVYDLMAPGHHELTRIAASIVVARDERTTFLRAFEQPGTDPDQHALDRT